MERRLPTSVIAVTAAAAGAFLILRPHADATPYATPPAGTVSAMVLAAPKSSASPGASRKLVNGTGTVTGKPVNTDFGPMQVQITVNSGKIVATKAVQVTTAGRTSERINARSLPVLYKQALQRQSAKVDSISGATVTSVGYQQALQSAIDAAHLR
ncbi:MAG TPA: FMN-binding protein [Kineosporiaceae bacterium]